MIARNCTGDTTNLSSFRDESGKVYTTFCETEEDWIPILNRDASAVHEDFNRNYVDFENGFGDKNGEFWIGLQKMHQLTTFPDTELKIDMELYNGTQYVAKYSTFKVGSQDEGYVLTLGGFSSTPSFKDDFTLMSNGMKFTTRDKDQDTLPTNCASTFIGGWWHKNCFLAKFTGPHFEGHHGFALGISWEAITSRNFSFKKVSMKVRFPIVIKN